MDAGRDVFTIADVTGTEQSSRYVLASSCQVAQHCLSCASAMQCMAALSFHHEE